MIDPNEPANPIPGGGAIAIGLTKREHFSAMAMQGLLASNVDEDGLYEDFARRSVRMADAILAELNKGQS